MANISEKYPKIGSTKVFLRHKKRTGMGTRYPHYFLGFYFPIKHPERNRFSEKIYPEFKSDSKSYYEPVAREFAEYLLNDIYRMNIEFDIIIPIPSSKKDRIANGHELLTAIISKKTGKENGTGFLNRITNIRKSSMSGLDRPDIQEHLKTLKCEGDINGKSVLLFDDIYTTGSTAGACVIKLLYEKKASDVNVITLGRTKGRFL